MKAAYVGLTLIVTGLFLVISAQVRAQDFFYPFNFDSPFEITEAYEIVKPSDKEAGIRLGPFRFKPGVQANMSYVDNPQYTSSTNKTSSLLFSLDPTFTFTLANPGKMKDRISFGYDADVGAYTKVTGNDYARHTLWANVDLMKRETTYLRLKEAVTYTDDPYGNQEFVGLGVSTRRIVNQTDLVLGRNLPRDYSVELGYQNLWENFLSSDYQDWTSVMNMIKPTLLYEVTGKTKLLFQYNLGYRSFYEQPADTAPNYFVQEFMTGVRWAATSRITGELKGGYAWQHFANDHDIMGFLYPNTSTPVYAASVSYMFSPKTTASFNAYRQFQVGGDIRPVTPDLGFLQDNYTRNALGLTLTTKTRPDLTFNLSGSYYLDQYEASRYYANRTDQYYNAGINFRHQLRRYLWWGLGYSFQKRQTEFGLQSFTQNAVTASVGLTY